MKIKKSISILVLALIITLSGIIGTLVYANKYTASNTSTISSSQGGNDKMQQGGTRPHGDFKNKSGTKPNGNPPSGDFKSK